MKLTDYKIRIHRDPGKPTRVVMKIYEGAETTEDERDLDGNLVPVLRYRRTTKIGEKVLLIDETRSDDKLRDNCDVELNKDDTRTAIGGQKRTVIRA